MNPQWLSAAGGLTTALAALVASWAALRGLGTWRSQLVGRRKTELAEDVLAQFYHARDVLTWARTPPVREPDGKDGGERSAGKAHALSAPIERITKESELFSALQAGRYRFIAYFGQRAAEPFEAIRAVHAEVIAAAGDLVRDRGGAGAEHEARRSNWEDSIGWGQKQHDRVAARVDEAVRRIEQICLPLIHEETGHVRRFQRRN
jgi:hypothetical protein